MIQAAQRGNYKHASPWPDNFSVFSQDRFHHVGQAGLELLTSNDPPALASQSVGIAALWEAEKGRSFEARGSRPAWQTRGNPISTKYAKISQALWHTPVIPATWEDEAQATLEPGWQMFPDSSNGEFLKHFFLFYLLPSGDIDLDSLKHNPALSIPQLLHKYRGPEDDEETLSVKSKTSGFE
ncbi:Histone demethylase UTY [Plecturocebus cupreus]